jgi:hypothetical protein
MPEVDRKDGDHHDPNDNDSDDDDDYDPTDDDTCSDGSLSESFDEGDDDNDATDDDVTIGLNNDNSENKQVEKEPGTTQQSVTTKEPRMLKFFTVFVVCIAALFGYVYQNNPLLFGRQSGAESKSHDIYTVFDHYAYLDDELFSLSNFIGKDLSSYRNHCLRVLSFTKFFLTDSTIKEFPDAMDVAATAIAYHRVGLWTDKNLNYLQSSKEQLETALGGSVPAEEMNIMREIILQQHKITDYTNINMSPEENDLINAVRKASWADATMGLIRFDLPAPLLEAAYNQVKGMGFHKKVFEMTSTLSPNVFSGVMEIVQILKW